MGDFKWEDLEKHLMLVLGDCSGNFNLKLRDREYLFDGSFIR